MSKKETVIKTMRMDVDFVHEIERMAKEQNRNFSNMVITLLKGAGVGSQVRKTR